MHWREKEKLATELAKKTPKIEEANFSWFIRTKDMEPWGIVTKESEEFDEDLADTRHYVEGLRFDGGELDVDEPRYFKEYLDWVNPHSGRLEPCTALPKVGNAIITARKTNKDEDDPDNFIWLAKGMDFKASRKARQMHDKIGRLRQERRGLREKIEEMKKEKNIAEREAELSVHEDEKRNKKLENVTEKLRETEAELEHYKDLMPDYVREKLERKGAAEEKTKDAEKKGAKREMNDFKRTENLLQELKNLKRNEQEALEAGKKGEEEAEVRDMLKENSEKINELSRQVEKITEMWRQGLEEEKRA